MKNVLKLALGVLFFVWTESAVAAPPKLMVLPDKAWCIEKGYVKESMPNGEKVVLEDYGRALSDRDFANVSFSIKRAFNEHGIVPVDASSSLNIENEEIGLNEFLKQSKIDVLINVGWDVAESSYSAPLCYRVQATDAYTGKIVAKHNGQAMRMISMPMGKMLARVIGNDMDPILMSIQSFFDDVALNGREISMTLRMADNCSGVNMYTEYDGKKLIDIINEWIVENSQNHQYTENSGNGNQVGYSGIRIPLKRNNGSSLNVESWANGLRHKLRELGVPSESYLQSPGTILLKLCE